MSTAFQQLLRFFRLEQFRTPVTQRTPKAVEPTPPRSRRSEFSFFSHPDDRHAGREGSFAKKKFGEFFEECGPQPEPSVSAWKETARSDSASVSQPHYNDSRETWGPEPDSKPRTDEDYVSIVARHLGLGDKF